MMSVGCIFMTEVAKSPIPNEACGMTCRFPQPTKFYICSAGTKKCHQALEIQLSSPSVGTAAGRTTHLVRTM